MIKYSARFNKYLTEFADLKKVIRNSGLTTDRKNSRFNSRYASLNNTRNTLEPIFEEHRWYLSVDMSSETLEGILAIKVTARLTFLGKGFFKKGANEWIEQETTYPLNCYANSGSYPSPQKIEATRTYGTRCSILSLVGVSAELDDDGNRASNTPLVENMQGAIEFDSKLDSAKKLSDIEAVLTQAEEAHNLGTLNSRALDMLNKKAEGIVNHRKFTKDLEKRKVERQAKIIGKLNTQMSQAATFDDLHIVWGNYHMIVDDLKDVDKKQLKYDLHNEAMRISKSLVRDEVYIAPTKEQEETNSTVEEIQDILESSQSDAPPQLAEVVSMDEQFVQPDLVTANQ